GAAPAPPPPAAGVGPPGRAAAAPPGAFAPPPAPPPPRGGAPIALRSGPYSEPVPFTRWQLRQLPLLPSKIALPRAASPGGRVISGAVCAYNGEPIVKPAAKTSVGTRTALIPLAA